MTIETDPAAQAINDARALLDTFLSTGWQDMYVQSGDTEIFLARPQGRPNPLRIPSVPVSAEAERSGAEKEIVAPHVATLVDILPVGAAVAAGQKCATLRVLHETRDVLASVGGKVVRVNVAAGDLVDYGTCLLVIAEAA